MPVAVALIAFLFFVFVVIYVGRSIHTYLSPSILTELVNMTTMYPQRSVTGMIIRYEQVYYATREGRVTFEVTETDRVRNGIRVARIEDVDAAERITQNRDEVRLELIRLSGLRHATESNADVQRVENHMRNLINNNMRNFTTHNIAELNVFHSRVSELTDVRAEFIVSDSRNAVGGTGRIYSQLEEQHRLNVSYIYARNAGIMFPILDGHETQVTPTNMRDLNRDDILVNVDHSALYPARFVDEGDPMFKVVGNNWYIAALMPSDMTQDFVQGSNTTIFVNNIHTGEYQPISVRVEFLEERPLQNFVIFRSTRYVMYFLNQRNVSIRTTDDVTQGLRIIDSAIVTRRLIRIPLTHIHGSSDNYFVHRHTFDGLGRLEVLIAEQTETHVYVMEETVALGLGDVLIPASLGDEPFTITEAAVRTEHGVYRATLGYAHFVIVNLDEDHSNVDGYVLLDPARNPNLLQFDVIVIDASTVTHGDILR